MHADYLGNPVWADNPATVTAIDDFVGGFLSYETRALQILDAADADPDNCLANVYAGMIWMFLEAPQAAQFAEKYLRAAQRTAHHASRREQLSLAVLEAWSAEDITRMTALCEQVSDEFPRDLVIVKLHQYLDFNRGHAPQMLRVALKVAAHNADVAHMHGMTAFAYEQCHLLDDAERAARRALQLQRKEPWAQHALAHVLLTRGQINEGAAFLEAERETWVDLNSFMYTHIWWHLALFYLRQGKTHEVLALYDQHCWGIATAYSQDQIGAVSLLARMELSGIDVGPRWHALGEHLAVRQGDTVQPFLTMQYLYGLGRAGRPEADLLLAAVRSFAAQAPQHVRAGWQQVAVPACEGLLAHARGDYARTVTYLGTALPRLWELGGSHAQRDLFDQLLLDALVRSGQLVAAQQWLENRRDGEAPDVPLNRTLADVYRQLGLPQQADQARGRALARL